MLAFSLEQAALSAEDTFNPFDCPATKAPVDDDWAARREVADAVRDLIGRVVTTSRDAATLRAAAQTLRAHADLLGEGLNLRGRKAFEAHGAGRHGSSSRLGYELNPLDGKANPISPPFNTWIEGDVVHGRATLGWQYEGPPDCVHGGFVCALFDQFLGIGQRLTGQPGVTGSLTVHFHRPTPLGVTLELVGRVKEVRGRKNFLVGELWANGVMTASADGLFIHVSRDRFRQLLESQPSGPG